MNTEIVINECNTGIPDPEYNFRECYGVNEAIFVNCDHYDVDCVNGVLEDFGVENDVIATPDGPIFAHCKDVVVGIGTDPFVTITPDDVNDGSSSSTCGVGSLSLSQDNFTAVGEYNVALFVTGDDRNVTSCDAVVTVVPDNAPPTIICPTDPIVLSVTNNCTAIVVDDFTSELNVTDNVDPNPVVSQHSVAVGALLGLGLYNVTFTAMDASGNKNSVMCKDLIEVVDMEAPTIDCPDDIVLNTIPGGCEAAFAINPAGTVTDNCDTNLVSTPSITQGAYLALGFHDVVLTTTDASGNENSVTCNDLVEVVDIDAPTITCPTGPIVLNTIPGGCEAIAGSLASTVTDNCDSSLTVDQSIGVSDIVGLGLHNVTFNTTDASGNEAVETCEDLIEVVDTEPPSITCPAVRIVLSAADNCEAIVGDLTDKPITTENCNNELNIVQDVGATDTRGLGLHNMTFTATDASGNEASVTCEIEVVDAEPLDANLINCGGTSTLSPCDIPYTFNASYEKNNGCVALVTPLSFSCTACDKYRNIFDRIECGETCEVEIDGDSATIVDVAGDDDFVQVTLSVVDDNSDSISATCTFCIDEAVDCGKSSKGRRSLADPIQSTQRERNLRGLKSTKCPKSSSFACSAGWDATNSSPTCPPTSRL